MKSPALYVIMKQAILILLFYTIRVKSETPHWAPIGNPMITNFPCEQTRDIVTWYDPSLPPREKNRYYVYIRKVFPENSTLRLLFDRDVTITFNVRTEEKTFVRSHLEKGFNFLLLFFKEMHGFGFIVKGVVPGFIPYFASITMNDEELCDRPFVGYLGGYVADTLNSGPQKNCGVPKKKLKNVLTRRGVVTPGDWPWHAAIYRYDETLSKYICGGTLISKTFVLTAAHCASLRGIPLSPEVLTVHLGKFNLKRRNIGTQKKEVKKIIIHEMFDYNHLYSDIALLTLSSEAKFTSYVQPACLWYSKAEEKLPDNTIIGTVVGWGLNGNRLKKVEMPMVSETTCALSDTINTELIYGDPKFCAGFLNGSSTCNSDSGSAFQVFVPDTVQDSETSRSGAWYVRGIVSLTASKFNTPACDPDKYVLFTDINGYRLWIDAYIDNEDY
ncbi:chymotrypsin-like elastase family member 2A [Nymphalis io]|uniref:chymotrypsin-like elastase family member 2A n=1 Tax=Inachis io TaxID=171585 RepID=UPI00216A4B61|nr:chymotrypsin-like elastase family member 2A [Nymphalis io]